MIDQSVYPAPIGLDAASEDLPAGMTPMEDGGIEIVLESDPLDTEEDTQELVVFGDNLAEHMDEGALASLASDLLELVDEDIASRKDWTEAYVKGLEVLGMKYEDRTEPWANACGVYSTVLTEAAIRFQSETIMETFPAAGPVKTEIIGAIDKLKEEAAARVRDDMNYRITEGMPEYRPRGKSP